MYAIVQVGGSQFKVSEGDVIAADKITQEIGDTVVLDKVLMVGTDADVRIGQPYVEGVTVTAEVVDQYADARVHSFHYRKRKDSWKTKGQRHQRTALSIKKIGK